MLTSGEAEEAGAALLKQMGFPGKREKAFDMEEESWKEPEQEEREAGIRRMTEWYLDGLIGYLAEEGRW